ncbi:hypothetical protein [Streptomyces sp. 891-h]|uniref:DUF6415 family natural product biosynthesis protein n=1 Tax=Streptomyces sp. 891-h TaxID=2720714 RepID=UPI001FAAAD42|nr:hypothetical protein [Streptomyces sp. 891-h]UNZ18189.1 hypothetical protein HC362_15190 [Streptomyces sp. 891-h]
MTITTDLAPAQTANERDISVLERLLEALRDTHAMDLVSNDVEVALGEFPPTPQEIAEFTPRLRRSLPQLVTVVVKRAEEEARAKRDAGEEPDDAPAGELDVKLTEATAAAIERTKRVLAETAPPADPEASTPARRLLRSKNPDIPKDIGVARGHLRRLAMATQELLDILLGDGE